MGLALWLTGGMVAFAIARIVPAGRERSWTGELVIALLTAIVCGGVATTLDFGGWREPEWRALLLAAVGALAAAGLLRLILLLRTR